MTRGTYKLSEEQTQAYVEATGERYVRVQDGDPFWNRKRRRQAGQRNPKRTLAPLGRGVK